MNYKPTIQKINHYFDVDVKTDKQYCKRDLVKAKKVCALVLRDEYNLKFQAISLELGYKYPSVSMVIYNKAKVDEKIKKEMNLIFNN